MPAKLYEYKVKKINGEDVSLHSYAGHVLLIVNTASKCGFTPQYEGLEQLYRTHKDQGLTILGFPCNQFLNQEPGNEQEIQEFCQINYGVSFPMFAKIDVNGSQAHPLYQFLKQKAPGFFGSQRIKWNFTKFLIDRQGEVHKRFAPKTAPEKLNPYIKKLL